MNKTFIKVGMQFRSVKTGNIVTITDILVGVEGNDADAVIGYSYPDAKIEGLTRTAERDMRDFAEHFEAI